MSGTVVDRFGSVNTVANCAKHHGVDVTDAMLAVSILKGQRQIPGAWEAHNRAITWPLAAKQDLKAIANFNWGEVYGK